MAKHEEKTFEDLVNDMSGYVLLQLIKGEFYSGLYAAMIAAAQFNQNKNEKSRRRGA